MVSERSQVNPERKFSDDLDGLLVYSKELGLDRMQIQAAGGNTSIKVGDTLWVKASGKWLSKADEEGFVVPMSISRIKKAIELSSCTDQDIIECIISSSSIKGLRPSVEAPMHAVLDFKYVVHTHDLKVIALTLSDQLFPKLDLALEGLDWKFVPYIKPGIDLCRQLQSLKDESDKIFILENHGLVVCSDNLSQLESTMNDIGRRLGSQLERCHEKPRDLRKRKVNIEGTGYTLCDDKNINELAVQHTWRERLSKGMSLPDCVVFLGPRVPAIDPDEIGLREKLLKLSSSNLPLNSCISLVDYGIIIRDDALKGTTEMILCMYDLMSMLPDNIDINYFTEDTIQSLLNWDAEKYRQKQNIF